MSGLLSLKWNNHSSVFLNLLQSLRVKELYCDTTIVCHGKFYPVHKLVLSTCSEYFEDIFERTECKHPFIIMKDIEPSQLEALLNYMYKGEVNVLQESLPGLIKAAEALKIKGLAVPDDAVTEERTLPTQERKRNTNPSLNSHPNKTRRLETAEPTKNYSHELDGSNRTSRETGVDHSATSPNNGQEENSSSQYHGASEFSTNSDAEQDPLSNQVFQTFVKSEPPETTDESPDVQPKEETSSFNFASLLPNDSVDSETVKNMESESYETRPPAPSFSMNESYQDCFSGSSNMREDLVLQWPEGRAGTSSEREVDGVPQNDPLGQMPTASALPTSAGESSSQCIQSMSVRERAEGVHKCLLCSFVTKWKCNLRTHLRRAHTGEKPFRCTFCSYRSCSSDSLRVHIRTHTGEKPYHCPVCPHRTAAQNNLVRHIRRQHTNKPPKN